MKRKKIISILLALVILCGTVTGSMTSVFAQENTSAVSDEATPDEVEVNPYSAAAQKLDAEYAYSGDDLGCSYTPEATMFKVWAPTSSVVKLNLYTTGSNTEEGSANIGQYEMVKDMADGKWTGCWTVTVEGDLKDVYYTYTVTNKTLVTEKEKTMETIDPYAKAVGVNGTRAMVVDLDSTDPEGWDNDAHIYVSEQSDAIVWEVVIRDFSASETSGVSEENRGKYLAFTETGTTLNGEGLVPTCVDYLKELGVTHVQINPMFDFATVNEKEDLSTQYNWGYDPSNYNVPDGSYSSNPYDGNVRINECKQMIQALHEAGIGVIMDVVFNHTYLGGYSNFQLLVPDYYYRFQSNGSWSGASGCGNDTASERAMFRKFMIDCCLYWVEEYHVDGFRFDLMGVHDVETMNLIREELDKIDPRILMYGEGWEVENCAFDATTCTGAETISASQANAALLNDRIGLFNDEVRDSSKGYVFKESDKGFIQGDDTAYMGIRNSVLANTVGDNCEWTASAPSQCVTYMSCHDNHALYDRLVYSVLGSDGEYRDRYCELIEMNKLSAGILFTSQGMSFMLAGEEMARSKDGDTNSYKSPVEENMIDWSLVLENGDLVSYYKGLIDIRNVFSPFTEGTNAFAENYTFYETAEETVNEEATSSDDEILYVSDYVAFTVKNDTEGEWENMAVIYNSSAKETKTITLDCDVTEWVVIADDTCAGLDAIKTVEGNTFEVAPSSCLIAVDKESFEACGFKSDDSKVIVKHADAETGKVLRTQVITGKTGNGYATNVDTLHSLEYDFSSIKGNATGVFEDEDVVVTYLYEIYKSPALLNADIDNNSRVTIADVTTIQKHLAGIITLSDEKAAMGDVDYNNILNIKDATLLQKHLAGYSVSIGTIVTNYYAVQEDGTVTELAPSTTESYRVGQEYEIKPQKISLYSVIEELTANASGILPTGVTTVDFYYEYAAFGVRFNVAHLDPEATWTPCLWAWGATGNAFSSWPGAQLIDNGDGWYYANADLPTSDFSIIISNNGTPQTADYTGLEGNELWIVIDDYNIVNKGNFITVYDEEPDLEALRAEYLASQPAE